MLTVSVRECGCTTSNILADGEMDILWVGLASRGPGKHAVSQKNKQEQGTHRVVVGVREDSCVACILR